MDIMDEILAARYNLLRGGHSAKYLWLVLDDETFSKLRHHWCNSALKIDTTTGTPHDMRLCDAPVILTRNVVGWRWLRTP